MSGTLVQAVGWALVHLVWQGALVAALLAVALRLVPRRAAQVRYALACGALLLLTVLPVLTAARSFLALEEKAARAHPVLAAAAAPAAGPVAHLHAAVGGSGPSAVPVDAAREQLLAVVGALEQHAQWVVLAWALGVMLASARVLAGWRQVVRLTQGAREAAPEWQAAVERLSDVLGIRVPVRLLASRHVDVPSTVGWLRPVVLVPVAALAGLPTRQLELILAHELAHIRRHDYLVNLAQTAAETLLFYHPAVWWVGGVIRAERENCCDDLAVASGATPVAYARALTALEALRAMPSPALSALGGSLPERVRRLVAPGARCASRWSVGASVLTLLLGLALTVPLAAVALPRLQASQRQAEAVKASETAAVVAAASAVPAREALPPEGSVPPAGEALPPEGALPPEAHPAPPRVALPHVAQAMPAPPARDEDDEDARDAARAKDKAKEKARDDVDARTVVGRDTLTVDQLVSLRTAGIDAKALDAYRQMGFEPTVENLVSLGHAGVTAEYAKAMRARFGEELAADDLAGLKHLGVTPEFVAGLERMGFKGLDPDEVMGAKAVGVSEDYLRGLKAAGLQPADLDELTGLRAVGVDAGYLAELGRMGLGKLDADDVQALRALGVDAAWVKGLKDAGLGTLSVDDLESLKALGVDGAFVRQMRDEGFAELSAEKLVELKASGITPEYLRQLRGR